jgi:hypothetical protein
VKPEPLELSTEIQKALAKHLSSAYVSAMLKHFAGIRQAYFSRDWETCCTKAGKFVEALLKGIHFFTTGDKLKRISVGAEIDRLTNLPQGSHNESIRLLIPRVCRALYHIASDRGARHDVTGFDPSRMDAEIATSSASFLLAELVRLFHPGNLTADDAQNLADGLVQRKIPLVTSVFNVKRVLNPKLEYSDKVLLLLNDSYPKPVLVSDLFTWVEHKNITDFKRKVLQKLHDSKYIEYSENLCVLLEPGLQYVEQNFVPR